MTKPVTGKIEFAPDYKSQKSSASDISTALTGVEAKAKAGSVTAMRSYDPVAFLEEPTSMQRRAQLLRLEREVIEAAKEWHHIESSTVPESLKIDTRSRLSRAVGALESFEADYQ